MSATAQSPLPEPDGLYAVGVQRFELLDSGRKGVAEDLPDQPRAIPAIIWYPANKSNSVPAPYFMEAQAAIRVPAIARNFLFDPAEVAGFPAVLTHSITNAAPMRSRAGFPIVIFSHGYFLYANQNQSLAEKLASHGYIVVAIDHPRDSVDVKTSDGRVVATNMASEKNLALFDLLHILTSGRTHDECISILDRYAKIFPTSRMGVSLAAWRDDTLFTVRALRSGKVPAPVRAVLAAADENRIALAGMSFGGATSAATCRLIAQCRAVINLDGANFEPTLFNGDVERPMLLIQSDWTRYALSQGQPQDPGFSPNDYSFERWTQAGVSGHVLRLRIEGVTHMGLTDLGLLMPGPKATERFGDADPRQVANIIGATSLAFLDLHLKHGAQKALDSVVTTTPGVVQHDPVQIRQWALSRQQP